MSARKRRRIADPDTVYTSGTRLVQRQLPAQRRRATFAPLVDDEKRGGRGKGRSGKRQSTLTQIDFVRGARERRDVERELFGFVGIDGDEVDSSNGGGQTGARVSTNDGRTRKRKKEAADGEDECDGEGGATPARKMRRRGKNTARTAKGRDQQTLTQGGYLLRGLSNGVDEVSSEADFLICEDGPLRNGRHQAAGETISINRRSPRLRQSVASERQPQASLGVLFGGLDRGRDLQQAAADGNSELTQSSRARRTKRSASPLRSPLAERSANQGRTWNPSLTNKIEKRLSPAQNSTADRLKAVKPLIAGAKPSPTFTTKSSMPPSNNVVLDSDAEDDDEIDTGTDTGIDVTSFTPASAIDHAGQEQWEVSGKNNNIRSNPFSLPQPDWECLEDRRVTQHVVSQAGVVPDDGSPGSHQLQETPLPRAESTCADDTSLRDHYSSPVRVMPRSSQSTVVEYPAASETKEGEQDSLVDDLPTRATGPLHTQGIETIDTNGSDLSDQSTQSLPGHMPYLSTQSSSFSVQADTSMPQRITFSQLIPSSLREPGFLKYLGMSWTQEEEL